MKRFFIILFFLAGSVYEPCAQLTAARIAQAMELQEYPEVIPASRRPEIKIFYESNGFEPAWTGPSGKVNRDALLGLLRSAKDEGLDETEYQYSFITAFRAAPGAMEDSLAAELKFTDAALHFFNDMANGNKKPAFGYEGLDHKPDTRATARSLAVHCTTQKLALLAEQYRLHSPEVKAIVQRLIKIRMHGTAAAYTEETIVSMQVSSLNKPLLRKLYYLGVSDTLDMQSAKSIAEMVKEAQRQFDLPADGLLKAPTLKALNQPLSTRVQQLQLALDYYRWLRGITQRQGVITVNIPAAYLKVYDRDSIRLQMRMIVGKPATPTPTLTSRVTEVVLYPYWNVPYSIATKELLPNIKRNPGYISANNFEVLNRQGKIVDPYSINWNALSASNFPYTIRQSTGCDNALGLIKLNFYNPFSVYLHDTPTKSLFTRNRRFFSHGCMRMEKPMDLGRMVLKNNTIAIDTLVEKGNLLDQSPINVPADEQFAVIVWYNPVGTDAGGRIIFYEDIYKKFSAGYR